MPLGPKLEDLVDIMSKVCDKWRKIGLLTGQADCLEGYATKARDDKSICCQYVFQAWIANGGHPPKFPHTWQGLYYLLCDIKHAGTANTMADEKAKMGIYIKRK